MNQSTYKGLDDDQLMRTIALGMAVIATASHNTSANRTLVYADAFKNYIETGQRRA